MPSRIEIAEAMEIELENLIRFWGKPTTSSLDAPVNGDEGRSFLGDLIVDGSGEEPLDKVEKKIHPTTWRWLSHLSEQEQHVIRLRFGWR